MRPNCLQLAGGTLPWVLPVVSLGPLSWSGLSLLQLEARTKMSTDLVTTIPAIPTTDASHSSLAHKDESIKNTEFWYLFAHGLIQ